MCKADIVRLISERTGVKRSSVEAILNAYQDLIEDSLSKGDQVVISGFGTFCIRSRSPRTGRNPHTKEAVEIPARTVPAFIPSDVLKNRISGNVPVKKTATKSLRSSPAK